MADQKTSFSWLAAFILLVIAEVVLWLTLFSANTLSGDVIIGLGLRMFLVALALGFIAYSLWSPRSRSNRERFQEKLERQRLIEEHATNSKILQEILDTIADGIMVFDKTGAILSVNPSCERIFGKGQSTLIGTKISELILGDLDSRISKKISQEPDGTNDDETGLVREVIGLRSDGTAFPLELTITNLRYNGKNEYTAQARDLTERRHAEETIRDIQSKYTEVTSNFPGFVFELLLVDPGHISFNFVSDGCLSLCGLTATQICEDSTTFFNRVHEDDVEALYNSIADSAAKLSTGRLEFRLRKSDGEVRWFSGTCKPRRLDDRRVVFYGVITDISSRKIMEEKLRQTANELERSNAELQQFAYVASHDLQEPMRMVAKFTELLAKRYKGKLDDQADEYIAYVIDGARRMQTLISDLLSYARLGTLTTPFETVDTNLVVRRVLDGLRFTIEEAGATVKVSKLPAIKGDSQQLIQLFQNLLSNAIKFRGETAPYVTIGAQRHGNEYIFFVEDNGIGIDKDYLDQIFVLFQRLHGKNEYPGSGIGLAICKKIVERHGGCIWADPDTTHGARLCFTLPLVVEATTPV
jgi:PAS domain S-box-containing protein